MYNNDFSNQEYKGISNFKVNSQEIREYINSLNNKDIILTIGLISILYNFISILIELILTIFIFGVIYYLLSKFFIHTYSTFLQICKRFLFLSIYLVIGFALCNIVGIFNSYIPLLIFGTAYFIFIPRSVS